MLGGVGRAWIRGLNAPHIRDYMRVDRRSDGGSRILRAITTCIGLLIQPGSQINLWSLALHYISNLYRAYVGFEFVFNRL